MTVKLQNIIKSKLPAVLAVAVLLTVWQILSSCGFVPKYMLPSPVDVITAFIKERDLLFENAAVTLGEAFIGLTIGVLIGFAFAAVMDSIQFLYRGVYPILVITQTIPTVAIAPLLVLWFGYEMTPKIILIVISTFFPVTVALLEGFGNADKDAIAMLRAMGASKRQVFWHIKIPSALPQFFSGLRIAAAYSVVGAVISEWLGGFSGLGVYMTRVKKAFAFDKMFAVIFLISALSLALMSLVSLAERLSMPYKHLDKSSDSKKISS